MDWNCNGSNDAQCAVLIPFCGVLFWADSIRLYDIQYVYMNIEVKRARLVYFIFQWPPSVPNSFSRLLSLSLSLSVSLVRFIGRFPSSPPGAFHTAPFRERLCLCSLCAHRNRDSRRAARWQTGRAERLSLWFSSDKESFTFDCRRSAKLNNRYRVPLQLVKAKAFVLAMR